MPNLTNYIGRRKALICTISSRSNALSLIPLSTGRRTPHVSLRYPMRKAALSAVRDCARKPVRNRSRD
jgi:hypothetical protein